MNYKYFANLKQVNKAGIIYYVGDLCLLHIYWSGQLITA